MSMFVRCLPAALLLSLTSPAASAEADGFVVDDVIVSDLTVPLVDPEFDQASSRMVWQDAAGAVWTAAIDPASGDLIPRNGMGTLVAGDAAPLLLTLNGPEWATGADGTFVVYTQAAGDGLRLAAATEVTPGQWLPFPLRRGAERFSPAGTGAGNLDAPARITCFVRASGALQTRYRRLTDPDSERVVPLPEVRGARWIDGTERLVASARIGGVEQIVVVETTTGEIRVAGPGGSQPKLQPFGWHAPALDGILIVAALSSRGIVFYRESAPGDWTPYNYFQLPTERGFVTSIEPFVFDGRSYIVAVAAAEEDTGVGGRPGGPSDIWIAAVDREAPFFRQITARDTDVVRLDPEPFVLEQGPVVFYNQLIPALGTFVLRRADTGLGAGEDG